LAARKEKTKTSKKKLIEVPLLTAHGKYVCLFLLLFGSSKKTLPQMPIDHPISSRPAFVSHFES
jgi:hypothetical protein